MCDLARVYIKYSFNKNLKAEIISEQDGQVIIEILGENAFHSFINEIGKHSIQRVPPTETKGRRHTSIITVAVLPLEDDSENYVLEKDVDFKTQGGTGPGGQHQNTSNCAVRAIHRETGISVFINGRSQFQNKKTAMSIISARVKKFEEEKASDSVNEKRRSQVSSHNRSDKRRTWNFIENRITDHILNTKTNKVDSVMNGDLDLLY